MAIESTTQDKSRPRHPEKARLPDTPVLRKPDWIRVKAPGPQAFDETRATLRKHRL
ncbi:MAG: lipoyl synthase, partial [Methyloceanibacter sp.]